MDQYDEFMVLQEEIRYEHGAHREIMAGARNVSDDSDVEERQFVVDTFGLKEREVLMTGYEYAHTFITSLPNSHWKKHLDQWPTRPNGSQLIPGQHKIFFRRLINGADIKNQTQSAIGASAICHYLNFFQLLQIWFVQQGNGDWTRSPNKIVRDFASKIEECIHENLITWLMMRTSNHQPIEDGYFSVSEKRFLGRQWIRTLGVMELMRTRKIDSHFVQNMSVWYLFLNQKDDSQTVTRNTLDGHNMEEPVGLFVEYPSMRTSLSRPKKSVLSLATLISDNRTANSKHYFNVLKSDEDGSLLPYVMASLKYQDPLFVQLDRAARTPVHSKKVDSKPKEEPAASNVNSDDDLDGDHLPDTICSISCESYEPMATHRHNAIHHQRLLAVDMANNCEYDDEENRVFETALAETVTEPIEPTAAVDEAQGFWGEDGYYYYQDPETGEFYAYAEDDTTEVPQEDHYELYWDPYWEMYIWYGMQVDYDAEQDWFYAYNPETEEYHYMDEEANAALINGEVPTWDYDLGTNEQEGELDGGEGGADDLADYEIPEGYYLAADGYCYPCEEGPSEGVTKEFVEEAVDENVVPASPAVKPVVCPDEMLEVADEGPKKAELPAKHAKIASILGQAMEQKGRFGTQSLEMIKASENMLFGRAVASISKHIEHSFSDQQLADLLDSWKKRPNGTLFVDKSKRLIVGLMAGQLELKSLPLINMTDMSSVLQHVNISQITTIRVLAQNSAWDRSPNSGMKVFALKADSTISEKTLQYCIIRSLAPSSDEVLSPMHLLVNGLPKPANDQPELIATYNTLNSHERLFLGRQIVNLFGAQDMWQDEKNKFGVNAYFFIPASHNAKYPTVQPTADSKPEGLFLHIPTMTVSWKVPTLGEDDDVYHLGAGASNPGYVMWNITAIPRK